MFLVAAVVGVAAVVVVIVVVVDSFAHGYPWNRNIGWEVRWREKD